MRLIDADALKEHIQVNAKIYAEAQFPLDVIIDNAPTVDFEKLGESLRCQIRAEYGSCDDCELSCPRNELIKLLDSARSQGEWIPVSERLPEDMQRVLIWFEYYRYGDFNCMYQTYGFGYVCDGKWSPFINGETGWQDYNIIAWQPLPEPYEKGGAK